jgi:hypothetical protein
LNESSEIFGKIIIVTLLISLFADTVLRATWNKMYFTIGVPIFFMRLPVNTPYQGIPFRYLFEEEFESAWPSAMVLKQMDAHSYAFREKLLHTLLLQYISLMHGLVIFEHEKSQVVVKGFANWTTLWLLLYFSLSSLNLLESSRIETTEPSSIIIVILVIVYVIQYSIFSKLGKLAAELCSKRYFLNSGGV